jgi:hypothetical protein
MKMNQNKHKNIARPSLDKCSELPRTADYTFNMSHATEDANRLVFIPLNASRDRFSFPNVTFNATLQQHKRHLSFVSYNILRPN